jgi:hypothetical protein
MESIMFTTIKVNPKFRPNGYMWYQSSFAVYGNLTQEEMVAHATKVCTTDRSLDRAHILNHLANGNYIIERTN